MRAGSAANSFLGILFIKCLTGKENTADNNASAVIQRDAASWGFAYTCPQLLLYSMSCLFFPPSVAKVKCSSGQRVYEAELLLWHYIIAELMSLFCWIVDRAFVCTEEVSSDFRLGDGRDRDLHTIRLQTKVCLKSGTGTWESSSPSESLSITLFFPLQSFKLFLTVLYYFYSRNELDLEHDTKAKVEVEGEETKRYEFIS